MNSRIAVIEYVTSSPHLEISLEAAFYFASQGYEVDYFHLASALPFRDFKRVFPLICANQIDRISELVFRKLAPHRLALRISESKAKELGLKINFYEITDLPQFDVGSYISSNDDLETVKNWSYTSPFMGVGIANSLIGVTRNPYPDPSKAQIALRRITKSFQMAYGWCFDLFASGQHSKVVLFNGRFAVPRAIQDAASFHGIEVYFHERGATDNKGYYCEPFSPHGGEQFINWILHNWESDFQRNPEETVQVAKERFAIENRGKSLVGESFNSDSNSTWELSSLRPAKISGKLRVVYFSSSDDEFGCLGPLTPKSTYRNQREGVLRLAELANLLDFDLIVRVHPNLHISGGAEKEWWDNNTILANSRNVTLIKSSHKIDSYEILQDMDVVVSWHSTLGIEAIIAGIPSINLSESHYFLAGATVDFPANEEELVSLLLKQNFVEQRVESIYPYSLSTQRSRKTYKFFKPIDAYKGTFMGHKLNN